MVVALFTTALTGAFTPTTASAAPPGGAGLAYIDPYPNRYTLSARGGWVNAANGGFLDGLLYIEATAPSTASNKWERSELKYTGPGGQTYHQLINADTRECLTHSGEIMYTETCVWGNNAHWWAFENFEVPCTPQPWCLPHRWSILKPWDAPTRAATSKDGIVYLTPRYGSGSLEQRVHFNHIPAPPW